jgi:hypothetical protein
MTGRIEKLATAESSGRITTHSGPVQFHFTYRKTGGTTDQLAVGQLVSFEVEKGTTESVVEVRRKESVTFRAGDGTAARAIRYQGFQQTRNIRSYKFQAWRNGEENQDAIVTADLALFRKYGVGIQEGPEICLRLVKAGFLESGLVDPTVWTRALSDKELLDHLSSQASPRSSRKKRI